MKANRRRKLSVHKNGLVLRIIKSSLFGCVITIAVILLFALLLKWEVLSENSIPVGTSIIKALCAGFVGFLSANGCKERAWLWGGVGGSSYIVLAFFAFTLVESAFLISIALLVDICMGFIAGVAGSMLLQMRKAKA